jgi:hypothetical protein
LARVGTVSRLISDGIGFVKVSEAQVSVKEMLFLRGKASYIQGSNLLMEDLQGLQLLF